MPFRRLGSVSRIVNACVTGSAALLLGLAACSRPSTPAPPPTPPALSPEALAAAAATISELEREYSAGAEPARRIEIIHEIALQPAPAALEALRRVRASTTDAELGEHVTRSLAFAFPAHPDATLALFRELLSPTEPADARTIAVETLREIESPATLPLWRDLEKDTDPDIQETARAAIEYLTGLLPAR